MINFIVIFSVFNFILSVPFFFFMDFSNLLFSKVVVILIKSFLEAGSFFCVMSAIKRLEISESLPFLVLTSGLVAIFSFFILNERLSLIEIFGLLFLLLGTYILQFNVKQGFFSPFKIFKRKGYGFILFALVLLTTSSILDKVILKNYSVAPNVLLGFQHLFLAFIFLFVFFFRADVKEMKGLMKNSLWIIFFVSIFTIIYRYTQFLAVKDAPVALVLGIKRISVFFAAVIGGKLFREKNLLIRTIGTAVMVLGAMLIVG